MIKLINYNHFYVFDDSFSLVTNEIELIEKWWLKLAMRVQGDEFHFFRRLLKPATVLLFSPLSLFSTYGVTEFAIYIVLAIWIDIPRLCRHIYVDILR